MRANHRVFGNPPILPCLLSFPIHAHGHVRLDVYLRALLAPDELRNFQYESHCHHAIPRARVRIRRHLVRFVDHIRCEKNGGGGRTLYDSVEDTSVTEGLLDEVSGDSQSRGQESDVVLGTVETVSVSSGISGDAEEAGNGLDLGLVESELEDSISLTEDNHGDLIIGLSRL